MNFQFTHPIWLLALILALPWTVWLAVRSDVSIGNGRKWTSMALRLIVVLLIIFALAGLQWLRPQEGVNVYFLIDRSDSVPAGQQEAAKRYINLTGKEKEPRDKGGVIVFGADTGMEFRVNEEVKLDEFQAVVSPAGTDLAGAIRLATAAFPETGQRKIVVFSDGNENIGDAVDAAVTANSLGVTLDVVPLGAARKNDVLVDNLSIPANLKKGQTFDAKIFIESDVAENAVIRLFRNDQFLGEQPVQLEAGKNLFSFPQTLDDPGFYSYEVKVEAAGDALIQNNQASGFTTIKGDPRILLVSNNPEEDRELARALQTGRLQVVHTDLNGFPPTLAEMQSYDSIFISNIAAGDRGRDDWRLLESAVRDFGVGLVCVGGDQTYGAGGYRGTPLEEVLPVKMELDSKKVLPRGALVLVMHGMEFNNGNQIARDVAIGCLDALGPDDEMGVLLWDGNVHWLFDLQRVGDKRRLGQMIAGMNQGDLPSFQEIMEDGYDALKKSNANLKHMIVFSDGDPGAPTPQLMQAMVRDKITVSSVLIAGHSGPQTMIQIANQGRGRFYNVTSPSRLPQVFLKETAVILKSAIFEDPFIPQQVASSEVIRGIGDYPQLLGYVATTPKDRADTPLLSDKGDPLLAHWQYGLGRVVAFTSDAKGKWAANWLNWQQYRQFWTQIAQWSLRKLETSDLVPEVTMENGQGKITVEALDSEGNYRNFLNLNSVVVDPKGQRQMVRLEQTGPGHYEASFPTREVGAYQLNLMDIQNGQLRGAQSLGASVSYSPEFTTSEPNRGLLTRLAQIGGGKILDPNLPGDNPFLMNRKKTFQPRDLWETLMKLAILLFVLDVGIRRIYVDREQLRTAWVTVRQTLFFWEERKKSAERDESLGALLARRDTVRSKHTPSGEPAAAPRPELFEPQHEINDTGKPEKSPAQTSGTGKPAGEPTQETEETPPEEDSTASRLLRAKRRAKKWE